MQPCATGIGHHAPAISLTRRPFCLYNKHARRSHLRQRQHASYSDFSDLSGVGSDDPYATSNPFAGLEWVQQNEVELRRQAEEEAREAERARSAGLELRGHPPTQQMELNEDEPARYRWHRRLAELGPKGDFAGAEAVVQEMFRMGHPPGPRAYHALVCTHLRGDSVEGALDAIRREVKAGIQPLPESYAAVVSGYVRRGDLEMADAVWASNRRSGVDCGPSWLVLTTAAFSIGLEERGMELLEQGESEGRIPDAALYSQLIAYLCRIDDVDGAIQRLDDMEAHGIPQDASHYSPIIQHQALHGEMGYAEELMLRAAANSIKVSTATIDIMMRGYLFQHLPPTELRSKVALYRRWRISQDAPLDIAAHAMLLEANLQIGDLQAALSDWAALRQAQSSELKEVTDEALRMLIEQLSYNDMPMELSEVLDLMNKGKKMVSPAVFAPDAETGCSPIAVWFHRRVKDGRLMQQGVAQQGGEDGEGPTTVVVDGVRLDATTLRVLNEQNKPVALAKLTVREIRAELTARRQPLSGNKKDLLTRLQKARKFGEEGSSQEPTPKGVPVQVTEEVWRKGKLVSSELKVVYVRAGDDEGDDSLGTSAADFDDEDDEYGEGRRRRRRRRRSEEDDYEGDEDDEDDDGSRGPVAPLDPFELEDLLEGGPWIRELMRQGKPVQAPQAVNFTNASAGLQQMISMHNNAGGLVGENLLTQQDAIDLITACKATEDAASVSGILALLLTMPEEDREAVFQAVGSSTTELEALAGGVREEGVAGGVAGGAPHMVTELVRVGYDEDWEQLFEEFDE